MIKKISSLVLCACMVFSSCENIYRDEIAELHKELDDVKARLDAFCEQTNNNIDAIQTMILALQAKDYVTGVVPVVEKGVEVGYKITFEKSGEVIIYHGADGQDGADGYTPKIGARQDSDGIYYWTLDGEWLTDDAGNRIKAVGIDGTDGQDAIAPQLKIEDGEWYISTDGGNEWICLGKAAGADGDTLFETVDTSDEYYVVVTLSDGREFSFPTRKAFEELLNDVNQMNENIKALSVIVSTLQEYDYIMSITPLYEDAVEIGYVIEFVKAGKVTIYHGKTAEDGNTPVIGVAKDTDGIYYWKVDGSWLLDENGRKVRAEGIDGAPGAPGADGTPGADGAPGADGNDGVTPMLKIVDGKWYISYENGADDSWIELGKATGDQGPAGTPGDAFFREVDMSNSDYVKFILDDGTEFQVPTWSAFEDLKLECETMNANIRSIQALVNALEGKVYVTGVDDIIVEGVVTGYTIFFSNGKSVTINHGKDGADGEDGAPGTPGTSPVIGVRQENGIWYWTLNDEYILDAEGHKIPTSGQDGKTPIVKVEDGKWLVSYDNGASWNEVGSAGKDGADGDSWFSGVDTTSEDYITIILADAQQTQITLPRYKELSVELSADVLDVIRGQANEVAYTITSNSALPKISVVTSNGWKAKVVKTDSKTGVISVTSPVEDAESSDLIVFVSDDTKTIMELVTLNQTELRITSISVSSQSMTFYDEMGAVKSLVASVAPANATYSLQWTSSDPSVAVVSSEGQITACAEGETTITVTEKYTGLYATCVVSVKTARSESKVGQYIYSDGSIGDSPAGAVARIFWKGDPSASDPMLKEEHPSCTHGLAVSMTTYGFASYIGYLKVNDVNKLPDSLYDTQNIVGYQNTSHLKYYYGYGSTSESNSSVLNNLTAQASAPDYSSGWYIPSVKECSILNNSSVGLSDERFWCSNIWYDAASGQKTVWPTCYFAYGAGTAEKGGAESRKYYYIFAF